jgi:hypothetical protein
MFARQVEYDKTVLHLEHFEKCTSYQKTLSTGILTLGIMITPYLFLQNGRSSANKMVLQQRP